MRSTLPSDALPAPAGRPRPAERGRRRLVAGLTVALALCALWAGGTSYYLIFHDAMLARFVAQQRATRASYEERVGALQAQLDRAAAERIASRDGLESRLATLAERQALIERRQGSLAGLGGAEPGPAAGPVETAPAPAPKTPPAPDPADPDAGFGLRMRGGDRAEARDGLLAARMAALEIRLDALSERQAQALGAADARTARHVGRLRAALLRAGLEPRRFEPAERGVGGPFVPVSGDAFDLALARAQRRSEDAERLRRSVAALPFRRPLAGEAAFTSGFGTRLDPFTRGLALHTGIDLRADHGTAARATAAGRVTAAEYNGGYGNMVEVDHGHGVVTRYAHLAGYAVSVGQRVEAGAIVGRVGSTGRSTGNHLHYETRIDGEPVDPLRFLQAGALLEMPAQETAPETAPEAEVTGSVSGDGLLLSAWQAWTRDQLQTRTRRK